MRKLSIIPILILFGALFTFSGCVQQKQSSGPAVSGTDGLVISFEAGMPPSSIYEEEQFDIGVLMDNKGQSKINIEDAAVFITGIMYSSYEGINTTSTAADYYKKSNAIELAGAYLEGNTLIPGGSDVASWPGLKYLVDITSGVHPVTFEATSCYKYSTTSRASLCLASAKAIRDTTGSRICEVLGEKQVSNSAAPVQVTKVTEYPYGSDGVKVMIEIQNVGSGEVYDALALVDTTDCIGLDRKNKNKIYINEVKLGGTALTECNWLKEEKLLNAEELFKGEKLFACMGNGVAGSEYDPSERCPNTYWQKNSWNSLENCKSSKDDTTKPSLCSEYNCACKEVASVFHFIRLVDGVKTLTCQKKDVETKGIAQEDLTVKFSYGYTDSVQASMNINAIEEY